MFDIAFHIQLAVDDERKSVCWVFAEEMPDEAVVERLQRAYLTVRDMQIRESALFVYPAVSISKGLVSESSALVPIGLVRTPVPVFMVNDKFLSMLEGDKFVEKLLALNAVLDVNSDDFIGLLSELDQERGLHCVAALK